MNELKCAFAWGFLFFQAMQKGDTVPKNKYWTIKAKSQDTAEIYIFEQIGKDYFSDEGITAKQFAADLKALGSVRQINLHLNSPGGNIWDGIGIYNVLRSHKAEKTGFVDGIAASIASAILCACDTVIMPENAQIYVHNPSGLCIGDSKDMLKMIDALDKAKSSIISIYRNKTGMNEQQISDLMDEEAWMNGIEAKQYGFADEVIEPIRMAAHFDLSRFKNVPANLKNLKKGVTNKMPEDINDKTYRKDLYSERERVTNILAVAKEFQVTSDVANQFITDGKTEDDFRLYILNQIRAKSPTGSPRITIESAHGGKPFRSFGEQLIAIKNSSIPGGRPDNRLFEISNAAAGMSEAVPSEGGFALQPDFTQELLQKSNEVAVLAPLCYHVPVSGNGLSAPIIDETSRETGSRLGGVQAYWVAEATEVTAKKPKLAQLNLALKKLMGVSYATDELLEDAAALEAVITRGFSEEIAFLVDAAIVSGSGVGQPLGVLNAACLVSVAKEGSQGSATIVAENILKMYSRMHRLGKNRGVWLVNAETWPQLFSLNVAIGTGGTPVFLPPGGLNATPNNLLLGRPIYEIEQCEALGTAGDILFCDFNEYLLIDKASGINTQTSIHVKFLTDETAFRFTYRCDGQPIWKSAITPYKGSASSSRSPFIALQSRT